MAKMNGVEGVFIPQKLAQWIADYMTVNSIPKVSFVELNNAVSALVECSKRDQPEKKEPSKPEPEKAEKDGDALKD